MKELLFMTWTIFILPIMLSADCVNLNIKISIAEDKINSLETLLEVGVKGMEYKICF